MSRPGSRFRRGPVTRLREKTTKPGTHSRRHEALPGRIITAQPGDFNYTERPARGFSVKYSSSSGIMSNICPIGHYTCVTQAVSRMDRSAGPRLRPLRTKLLALEKENER